MNETEIRYLESLKEAMRVPDDGLSLALFNEYRDYQMNFKGRYDG